MTSSGQHDSIVVYDGAVVEEDLERWVSEFDRLMARVDPLFRRKESKSHVRQYVRGLLSSLERKNGWTISEYVGAAEPKALQRLLNLSPWNVEQVLALNRVYALEHLAHPEAILVADPTGFAKKGTKSVGVQRQYSGTLGRVDNCQIATFIAYVTPGRDRVLLDRRLYLPKSWVADPARCLNAGMPADTAFKTRPEQVIDMITDALAADVPFAWFTADEEFGQNPALCAYLQTHTLAHVMAVPKNTIVTTADGTTATIEAKAARLNHTKWQRRSCGIGTKGFRVYDWTLFATADPDIQFMVRRSLDGKEHAYYRCYNPRRAGFGELVNVAGARWPIEECFGAGKNEVGLDNYQVRTWDAWHRHITLSMLAHTFLAIAAHTAKKRGPDDQGNPSQNNAHPDHNNPPAHSPNPNTGG